MHTHAWLHLIFALVFSPLLFGCINRIKAFFAGRKGVPLLQLYYDLGKLFRKGIVYSRTTTAIFKLTPLIVIITCLAALSLLPSGSQAALIRFDGDLILFVYLLGLIRFFMVLAALDTGSAFEGMGASREVSFALFAEPALIIGLAALIRLTGQLSLSSIYQILHLSTGNTWLYLVLVAISFYFVFLAENARVPVDDPNTHLELTMIHEVMILDYSGPDLGLMLYGSAIKFWLLGTLLTGLLIPAQAENWLLNEGLYLGGLIMLSFLTGIVESIMARLRLNRVPLFLCLAVMLSVLALFLQ